MEPKVSLLLTMTNQLNNERITGCEEACLSSDQTKGEEAHECNSMRDLADHKKNEEELETMQDIADHILHEGYCSAVSQAGNLNKIPRPSHRKQPHQEEGLVKRQVQVTRHLTHNIK